MFIRVKEVSKKHSIVRISHTTKSNEKVKDEMRKKNLLVNFLRQNIIKKQK